MLKEKSTQTKNSSIFRTENFPIQRKTIFLRCFRFRAVRDDWSRRDNPAGTRTRQGGALPYFALHAR